MLNPFINVGLEVALKELFRDQFNTEQIYQVRDLQKTRLIVYVSPNSLRFVFVEEDAPKASRKLPQYHLFWESSIRDREPLNA